MMSPKPKNKWHRGLMGLFGYMDSLKWSVLWCLAEFADDDGNVDMTDEQIADAMGRDRQRIALGVNSTVKRMTREGLVKVVQRRRHKVVRRADGTCYYATDYPRLIQLYQGIQYGRIPPGSNRVDGLIPHWYYKGCKVHFQTHKLFRDKFKPKVLKPKYEDRSQMTEEEIAALVPSASYRDRQERKRVALINKKRHTMFINKAKKREFL